MSAARPSRTYRLAPVAGLAMLLMPGCGGDAPATGDGTDTAAPASDAAAPVIDVTATEFSYAMPDTVPSGPVTFRLVSTGQELHHIQLVRLADGKSMADMFAEMNGEVPPDWAVLVGGPNASLPGTGETRVSLDLAPGDYVALCVIPSPDGTPHVAKGMSKAFTAAAPSGATLPAATATMALTDHDFTLDGALTSGPQVLDVVNNGPQPHEVFIAKLAPGKTAADMLAWIEKMEGPPPGEPAGGTVVFAQGLHNYLHLDLTPGEYGLFCFYPDTADGKPHVAHGMMKQITVL